MARWIGAFVLLSCSQFAGLLAAEDRPISYNRDIRPILSNNCYQCHGPDPKHREGGLRLDVRDSATTAVESGKTAIVAGKLEASELVARIGSADSNLRMPPEGSGKSLTPEQIDLLKRWVDSGAEYQGHWAFIAPQHLEPPAVQHEEAVRNPIDRFVLARLEQTGLEPSPEADRVTLIRRLTFDLIGLPPTPAEVDAFLADTSPNAYEHLVDRLLQSPRYGEHMARYWLDAARYGDTHGLHLDNERSLWPYREWVIDALNSNMPFDRFTIEQIAGDLLPNSTVAQKVASGFNRCNVTTSEGGSINDEVLVRYAVDRTEAIGTIFMGLTLNCTVCHSHKFDPISQKEFYSLYSFFYSLSDQAMDGNALLPPPTMKLPTPEQTKQLQDYDRQINETQQQIGQALAAIKYNDPSLEDRPADALTAVRQEFVWIEDELPTEANPQQSGHEWRWVTKDQGPVYSGQRSHTRTGDGLIQHFFNGAKPELKIGQGDRLFAWVYLDQQNPPKSIMLQFHDGQWEHRMYWGEDVIPWGQSNTPARRHGGPLPPTGQWVRMEVDAELVGLPAGKSLNGWAFTQQGGTVHWDRAGLLTTTAQGLSKFDSLLVWEESIRKDANGVPGNIVELIKLEGDKRNDLQKAEILNYFLQNVYAGSRPTFDPLNKQIADLKKSRTDLDNLIPATMISEDLAQPRQAFVLIRGAYDKKGDPVERGVPAVFPPLPEGAPVNRLGLAQWLVSPSHPLTARVTVNRYWQQFFGTGIVKTAEDFGSQGEWPSHPELLDWLATEFVSTGWDVKKMHKRMVMSGTYRQASRVTPEVLAMDPDNRLLAHGPRFRLDAEVIRDSLLAISGLLVEREGGKSVKPPQPEGIWEAVAFVGSNTRDFKADEGEKIYRRSLYTFWKRTSPPPTMLTFDAPSRENCTVRRPRTNTPLQALALMNERQSVEAARKFAGRLIAEGGATPAERIGLAFRLAVSRKPTPRELEVVARVLERQRTSFTADPQAAEQLASYGDAPKPTTAEIVDFAAWTMVANLILNLDETITKE